MQIAVHITKIIKFTDLVFLSLSTKSVLYYITVLK